MKKIVMFAVSTVMAFSVALTSYAAEMKVAVIDVQLVVQNATSMVKFRDELKTRYAAREKELQEGVADLRKEADKFRRDQAVMTETDRGKMEKDITDKELKLQEVQAKLREDMMTDQNTVLQKFLDDVKAAVDSLATKQGYTLVLTKSGVAYSASGMDITDDVLQALNSKK